MLFEDKVIVVCYSKGENFVVAVSRADGQTVWKTPCENPTQSYSPPLIRQDGRPRSDDRAGQQGGDELRSANRARCCGWWMASPTIP